MYKTILISTILFLFLQNSSLAQEFTINGKIIEKESREPLPGATIAIYTKNDNVLVKGTVTDTLGQFKLTGIFKGKYVLEVSYLGFKNQSVSNLPISDDKDLGVLKLQASEALLDEVQVTAEKSTLVNDLDKKVYNVGKDLLAASSSVSEILQNIPSVSVDINGGISLRNTSNITIFINGRPSAMLRRKASTVLSQIPASSIERIEIITNPSAKYRPDGVGGIINIVLKKDAKPGINGQVTVNAGNEERYGGNVNLNYKTEALNLFGNYGIKHSNGTFLYTDDRVFKNPENGAINNQYFEDGDSKTDALSHYVFAGANYEINDFNSIELSGTYFYQNSFHKGVSDVRITDAMAIPEADFINNETNDEFEKEGEFNLAFEHIFDENEDHTLNVEGAYSAFKEEEDLIFIQNFSFPDNNVNRDTNLIQKSGNQEEIAVDYVLPISEDIELETGYAGEFVNEDIRYNADGDPSRFLFNQQIHALYALYGQSFEKFSFKVGLRAEQTLIDSHIIKPLDSLYPNDYFKIYPTLHLGYEINDTEQISLSYSKRVNRPDSDELNPNPEFSDPRNAEAGNPDLKPEQVHSLEFSYQANGKKINWTSSLYYRYTYDAFTSIQRNIGDTLVLQTAANLLTRQAIGLESVLSGKLFDKIDYDITGDVFYATINAENLDFASRKSSISGTIKSYTLFKITTSTSLQLNAFYFFPSLTPQGKRDPFFYLNGGLKQQLFNNKASLTLTATDILHTYKVKNTVQSRELDQTRWVQRKAPVVLLGFSWRFNDYNGKEKLDYEDAGPKK